MKVNTILECAILAFIAYGFIRGLIQIFTVRRRGVGAEGVISRVETHDTTDGDGMPMTYYSYYVRFETREGRLVEAALSNPASRLAVGDRVKVKYLAEDPEKVVLMEKLY